MATTPADGLSERTTWIPDLQFVNERLRWNPYPPDFETRRRSTWEWDSQSPKRPPMPYLEKLDLAMHLAERAAKQLARHHEGRVILVTDQALEGIRYRFRYWEQRSIFYDEETRKLEAQEYSRESRSVTPKMFPRDMPGASGLSKARIKAHNCVQAFLAESVGRPLLEADPNYWLDRKGFAQARREMGTVWKEDDNLLDGNERPPHESGAAQDEALRERGRKAMGDRARLPEIMALLEARLYDEHPNTMTYWLERASIYNAAWEVLAEDFEVGSARRYALSERKSLSTFPEGRRYLREEDDIDQNGNKDYWEMQKERYLKKHLELRERFWQVLKRVRFNRETVVLELAMRGAHFKAHSLARFSKGKTLLAEEDAGDQRGDFKYWDRRTVVWDMEQNKLRAELDEAEASSSGPSKESLLLNKDEYTDFVQILDERLFGEIPSAPEPEDLNYLLNTPRSTPSPNEQTNRRPQWPPNLFQHESTRPDLIPSVERVEEEPGDVARPASSRSSTAEAANEESNPRKKRDQKVRFQLDRSLSAHSRQRLPSPPPPVSSTAYHPDDQHNTAPSTRTKRHTTDPATADHDERSSSSSSIRHNLRPRTPQPSPERASTRKIGVQKPRGNGKTSTQSQRRTRRKTDSAYRGTKPTSQIKDPISSRLRNSKVRFIEESL